MSFRRCRRTPHRLTPVAPSPHSLTHTLAAPAPRLVHTDAHRKSGPFVATFTSLGFVQAPPQQVWGMISQPAGAWASWLTSLTSVKERRTAPPSPFPDRSPQRFEVEQITDLSLLGKTVGMVILLAVETDPVSRSVRFRSVKGNSLMRAVEGRFLVWPAGTGDSEEMREALAHVPGAEVARVLAAHAQHAQHAQHDGGGGEGGGSLVLIQHSVEPNVLPPAPFKGMLRQHLARHFEVILQDLQKGAEKPRPRWSPLTALASWPLPAEAQAEE